MAAGMAALVNDQVQETFQTNQERLEVWKEELEKRIEDRLENMKNELEHLLKEKSEDIGGSMDMGVTKRERSFKTANPVNVNIGETSLETEAYNNIEKTLRMIFQQLDEGKRNMSELQSRVSDNIAVFRKKVQWLRRNVKKHGVFKHGPMIERLSEKMTEKFKEMDVKFSDWESERQLSDEEILNTLEQTFKDIDTRMNQGKTNVDSFLENIADKIEDLQKKMRSMEEELQRLERKRSEDRSHSKDGAETDDVINDTKLTVERDDEENAPKRRTNELSERTMAGTGFAGRQEEIVSTNLNITLSGQ